MIIIGATFGGDAIKGGTVEDKFGTYWSFAFLTGLLLGLWALIAGGLAVFKAMKLRITALVILLFVGGVGILFGASMILTTNAGGSWAVNIPMFFPKDFLADTLNNTKDELAYVDTGTHDVYGQDVESDLDSLFGNPPENAGLYLVDFINKPSTITTTSKPDSFFPPLLQHHMLRASACRFPPNPKEGLLPAGKRLPLPHPTQRRASP